MKKKTKIRANRQPWNKMLLTGSCLLMLSAGSALAAPVDAPPTAPLLISENEAGGPLAAKHAEIDEFLFGSGQDEIAELGIHVTNTGVIGDKVEIGISPYDEAHAEFLYEKFGREEVQVVEGQQAVLFATGLDAGLDAEDGRSEKQREIDDYVAGPGQSELAEQGFSVTHTGVVGDKVEVGIAPYEEGHAEFLYEKFGRDEVQVVEGEQAMLFGAADAEPISAAAEPVAAETVAAASSSGNAIWIAIAAAIAVVAGIAIAARKKLFSKA
ncbi:hypothetical protein ACF3MZ_08240 [Paenibacillaceae bacterium WGS1546]|uniref:hypothetical protein n=1 Tax=Cohnella sp. WGS1546 TaxID=3366810 RepID=UPI00372D40F3